MIKIKCLAAFAAATALALPALAQTQNPDIEKRPAPQEARVQKGAQSGQLTPKSAKKPEKGQTRVAKKDAKAKAGGKDAKKERKKIA